MIHNVNDLFVEIDGQLFPAGNIQVWKCYPELYWSEEHMVYYGLYFDLVFEDESYVTVSQERTDELGDQWYEGWTIPLDHFKVETAPLGCKDLGTTEIYIGEEKLAEALRREIDRGKFKFGRIMHGAHALANSVGLPEGFSGNMFGDLFTEILDGKPTVAEDLFSS